MPGRTAFLTAAALAAGLTAATPATGQSTDLTLEIRRQQADYAEWLTALTLGVPEAVTFRWTRPAARATTTTTTTLRTALTEKAQWQLVAAAAPTSTVAFLPSSLKGTSGLPLFALYSYTSVPVSGSLSAFTIPATSLPAKPAGGAIWVRVVFAAGTRLGASPWLKITMLGAADPVHFTDLPPTTSEQDWDQDGMPDLQEYHLAEEFKPTVLFDSDEANRRPAEPVVLFQARPKCIGMGCTGTRWVSIKYALLFAVDGGYGPSSDCGDRHNGDNQSVVVHVSSPDGRTWTLASVQNARFIWPLKPAEFWPNRAGRLTHPVIYMSGHKHHQYFDTSSDGDGSPYSSWGCNDDVNGKGARVVPSLRSPVPGSSASRPNNVGEPEAHDPAHFIGDLSAFGYPGEGAWSAKSFKGGLPDDGGVTSSLRSMWLGQ